MRLQESIFRVEYIKKKHFLWTLEDLLPLGRNEWTLPLFELYEWAKMSKSNIKRALSMQRYSVIQGKKGICISLKKIDNSCTVRSM